MVDGSKMFSFAAVLDVELFVLMEPNKRLNKQIIVSCRFLLLTAQGHAVGLNISTVLITCSTQSARADIQHNGTPSHVTLLNRICGSSIK